MISRESFVKTMNSLQKFEDDVITVDAALKNLCDGEGSFFLPQVSSMIMELLQEIFQDDDDWLPYFMWEKNYLQDLEPGDIRESDGNEIQISSWEDVYDFLERDMKE